VVRHCRLTNFATKTCAFVIISVGDDSSTVICHKVLARLHHETRSCAFCRFKQGLSNLVVSIQSYFAKFSSKVNERRPYPLPDLSLLVTGLLTTQSKLFLDFSSKFNGIHLYFHLTEINSLFFINNQLLFQFRF